MNATPTILLLHARDPHDPMLAHEFECFVRQSGLPEHAFRALNLGERALTPDVLDGADAVMIGGSGAYSVVKGGFDWLDPMLRLMREVVDRGVPTMASCFGHQAMAMALGGELEGDVEQAELGTKTLTRLESSHDDPLYGSLPMTFDAQLGHNDSVTKLPQGVSVLARSERCDVQALRVDGLPIYTTQFHPELTDLDNIKRYLKYLSNYKQPGETDEQARQRARELHRPSPHANGLVRGFLETFVL